MTYEEKYGIEKAKEINNKKSKAIKKFYGKKQEKILCACGCGTLFDKYDSSWRPRKYLTHHRVKGKNHPMYGKKVSEETKQKLRVVLKGRSPPNKGVKMSERLKKRYEQSWIKSREKRLTEEQKRRIGIALKGRVLSDETKIKISLANKGKLIGRKISKSTKEKIGLASRGKTYEERHGIEKAKKLRELRRIHKSKQVTPFKDSSIEIKIQEFLTKLHIEFFTHKYISEISHAYQCDILIPIQKGINKKIIIECDGCFYHCCPICKNKKYWWTEKSIELDKMRTKELEEKGFKVIRLWEHEINEMAIDDFKNKFNGGNDE